MASEPAGCLGGSLGPIKAIGSSVKLSLQSSSRQTAEVGRVNERPTLKTLKTRSKSRLKTKADFQFELFAFPREIRNLIYEFALIYVPWGDSPQEVDVSKWKPKAAAICLTCRRCYEEANPILYSINTFHFANPIYFAFFSKRIGPKNCSLIRSISILTPSSGLPLPLSLKSQAKKFSQWSFALAQSRLQSLSEIRLIAQHVCFTDDKTLFSSLNAILERAIIAAFKHTNIRREPTVILTGYGPKELDRFPEGWMTTRDTNTIRFYKVFHSTSRAHSTGRDGDEYYLFSPNWALDNDGPFFVGQCPSHFHLPMRRHFEGESQVVLPRQAENAALRNLYRYHDVYWVESKGHSLIGINV